VNCSSDIGKNCPPSLPLLRFSAIFEGCFSNHLQKRRGFFGFLKEPG
jgi:hypothetical protein